MTKKIFVFITGICLLISPSMTLASFDEGAKEVFEVMKHLDMQGHADDDFSTCSIQQLYYKEIEEMLNDGMTKDEIIQSYVDEYGQAALREPGKDGNGLIAWGMPVIAFLFGVIIVSFGMKKLTNKQSTIKTDSLNEHPSISETEAEILKETFDEERRKHF